MQIDAIRTQVRYETEAKNLQEIKELYKNQSDKNFWVEVALIIGLAYAIGK